MLKNVYGEVIILKDSILYHTTDKEYNENNKLLEQNDVKMNDLREKCIIAKNIIKKCGESIDDINDFEFDS